MLPLLKVAFGQGVRGITLILLPLAFLSLITWATAGSSTGNTADPMRAAIWFFLIAHHVPLDLSLSNETISGRLTFFPIGALIIPFLVIKNALLRMSERLGASSASQKRAQLLALSFSYSLLGTLLSLLSLGSTVKAPLYVVFPILFLVSAVSGYISSNLLPEQGIEFPWQRALKLAYLLLLALVGFAGLVFSFSLIWNFNTVLDLTRVIEPGIFGGLAFLIIQILYLPNFFISTLSYIAGSGVVIGNGTWLNPFVHRLDEIPAISLLGGLPIGAQPLFILLALVIVGLGTAAGKYGVSKYQDEVELRRFILALLAIIAGLTLIIARASSGELLSPNLESVGPHWYLMPLALSLEIGLGVALFLYTPVAISKLRNFRT
ncbi:MAG: hypothetical protein EB009_02000 [Actinobacteria bacterium]|nr:hypothetical protein [Actinomycetota bacterium]NCV16461.1 hypothetical protein [Actinomycetota bacterium]NDA36084.1 hypothetical protein [Actinomycetota bacterium]NDA57680.1 hypothetical protein [Actinomycetota bacterium]NDD07346.1 hypothetical protein [Actinomycetota bacterium]